MRKVLLLLAFCASLPAQAAMIQYETFGLELVSPETASFPVDYSFWIDTETLLISDFEVATPFMPGAVVVGETGHPLQIGFFNGTFFPIDGISATISDGSDRLFLNYVIGEVGADSAGNPQFPLEKIGYNLNRVSGNQIQATLIGNDGVVRERFVSGGFSFVEVSRVPSPAPLGLLVLGLVALVVKCRVL